MTGGVRIAEVVEVEVTVEVGEIEAEGEAGEEVIESSTGKVEEIKLAGE